MGPAAEAPPLYKLILNDGRFDAGAGASPAALAATAAAITAEKPDRLVVHLHGGLIGREAGEVAAGELAGWYREAGATPLFLIWESGWQDIITQKLASIGADTFFQRILSRVAQFVRGKLDKELGPAGGRGVDDEMPLKFVSEINAAITLGRQGQPMFPDLVPHRLPIDAVSAPDAGGLDPAEQRQIEQEIGADVTLTDHMLALQAGAPSLVDPEKLRAMGVEPDGAAGDRGAIDRGVIGTLLLAKRVVTIVARVIWRFSHRRDHGAYLTIVEEVLREFYVGGVGTFLWNGMKDAVANAFAPDAGGTALVATLQQMWLDGLRPTVTLVGHSAGAIYAARLLKALNAAMPPDFKANLILIAPACTFAVLADALESAGSRISGLRMFGMGDKYERGDAIAGPIYPASLLYFVSGVLEAESDAPLVGMQRYYDGPYDDDAFPAVAAVKRFDFMTRAHARAWSMTTGFEGGNCDMTSHGGWVNAKATRLSVMAIIREGYAYA